MKKITAVLLATVLVVGLSFPVFGQIEGKKAEIEKVRQYIKLLDVKIKKARAAKKVNKIAQLKDLKRKELARAGKLKLEIEALEKAQVKVKAKGQVKVKARRRGLQLGVGLGGGAGMLRVGYRLPLLQELDVVLDAGVGMGNEYTVITGGAAGIFTLGNLYTGLELCIANYSETVTDILGVSGNIDKGAKLGFGVFVGRPFGRLKAQVGYNSALGLTAGAVFKF
jgi:hypothetical protein